MVLVRQCCWLGGHWGASPHSSLQAEWGWPRGSRRRLSFSPCSSQGSQGNPDFSYSFLAVLAACACCCLDKTFLSIKKNLWGIMTHHHQPLHLVRDQNCWRRNFDPLKEQKHRARHAKANLYFPLAVLW